MARALTDFFSQDQIDKVVNGDNGKLRRLPGLAFRSEDYHAFELTNWLNRTWLFVGRRSQNPADDLLKTAGEFDGSGQEKSGQAGNIESFTHQLQGGNQDLDLAAVHGFDNGGTFLSRFFPCQNAYLEAFFS